MIRLNMTVEGQTEQRFAETVLVPHLAQFQVYLNPPRFVSMKRRTTKNIPKGGLDKFANTLEDMRLWMKEDKGYDARFTMMVDFYRLPEDFPGCDSAMKLNGPQRQVAALEQALADELGDKRFVPYLQLHEFEALLFTDLRQIGTTLNVEGEFDQLIKDCVGCGGPEMVNGGPTTHPYARIEGFVKQHPKPELAQVAADIGLPALRVACPHFNSWLTTLEQPGIAPIK